MLDIFKTISNLVNAKVIIYKNKYKYKIDIKTGVVYVNDMAINDKEAPVIIIVHKDSNIEELKCHNDVLVFGNITGNVSADGSVSCDNVGGNISSTNNVSCDNVSGSITAGSNIVCDDVGGNVTAGNNVSCDDVGGNAKSGGNFSCGNVYGNVTA